MADPLVIHPEEDYRTHLAAGRFMLLRSESTGEYVFYPRVAAPRSGARDLLWVPAGGGGTVYASTVMRPRPPETPYNVAIVELDEGPRMLSRVEGLDPAAVRPGLRVRARVDLSGTEPIVVFDAER